MRCNLTKGVSYQAYLYTEDLAGNQDGALTQVRSDFLHNLRLKRLLQAIAFSVPASNWLVTPLTLTNTPTVG